MSDDELDDFLNFYSTKNTTSLFKKQLCTVKQTSTASKKANVQAELSKVKEDVIKDQEVPKENATKSQDNVGKEQSELVKKDAVNLVSSCIVSSLRPTELAIVGSSPVACSEQDSLPYVSHNHQTDREVRKTKNKRPTKKQKIDSQTTSCDDVSVIESASSQASEGESQRSKRLILRNKRKESQEPSSPYFPIFNSQTKTKRRTPKKNKAKVKDFIEELVVDSPTTEPDDSEWNYEVTVKVLWKSVNVVKFTVKKFERLDKIYEHFVKEEGVSRNDVLLTLNGSEIRPTDTPESLKISVVDFIEGGIVKGRKPVALKSAFPSTRIKIKQEDGTYITIECPTIVID